MEQGRLLADHQDRVEAANRLKPDHILAETVFAGIHNFFEFRDNGLWTAIDDRENSDRLPPHPVEVEAQGRIHCGAAFRAATLDQQQVSRRIGAYHSGFGRETVHGCECPAPGPIKVRPTVRTTKNVPTDSTIRTLLSVLISCN